MKNWQVQLGGWGSILWASVLFNAEIIREKGWDTAYQMASGYIIGFITAFVGYLFWEVIHGRWESVLGNERGFWRYFSAVPLFVLTVVGLLGFLSSLVGSFTWQYNISFFFAGVVIAQGLAPIINEIDGGR
ncbi:hypothetical protein [Chromohalobacter japonicus]|uniref:hypothetical protein n=1 Tax=Chromohalobacter japonicus TaxID=223900 RepID=UPI00058BAA28|nr:hypothetical protein [Chromohalobacter japonicus]